MSAHLHISNQYNLGKSQVYVERWIERNPGYTDSELQQTVLSAARLYILPFKCFEHLETYIMHKYGSTS